MSPDDTIQQILAVIRLAIESGLSDAQRYPAMRRTGREDYTIYIQDSPDLSVSLKDRPYAAIYDDLQKSGAFNLRMIDGALVQMLYTFKRNEVTSHRLCVFPSPSLEIYERAQQEYEGDELYSDIIEHNVVRFPIRFDFSNDDQIFVDMKHPKSHLTLGQYENCRIPVASPLTPARFISFVIRQFYNPAFERFKLKDDMLRPRFDDSISASERTIAHFVG